MKKITYLNKKDVREPIGDQIKLICHCCNDIGAMGSGVAKALFLKWPTVRTEYIADYKNKENSNLGDVQYIPVEKDTVVCNIIGQHTISKNKDGGPPVRYWAIKKGFDSIRNNFQKRNFSIHIPYLMGSELAGGRWEEVEAIINDCFAAYDIDVYIYDIDGKRNYNQDPVIQKNEDEDEDDVDFIF